MMFLLIATATSLLLAAIMSVIAWRVAGDERRRSEARVNALAAEIHADLDAALDGPIVFAEHAGVSLRANRRVAVPPAPRANRPWDADLELRPAAGSTRASAPAVPITENLFASPPAHSPDRAFVVVGGGALAFAAAIAVAILIGGDGFTRLADRGLSLTRSASPVVAAAPAALPLELVALGHERVGTQLTVRGMVRTPASGAAMDQLTAVVVLFTPDDEFIASGRAAVTAVSGNESTFAITVPGISDGVKYRVSFRRDERIVPHLDKRHES